MRLRLLKRLVAVFFILLLLGLVYQQIIKGPYYFQLSQNNRIKLIKLAAPRGIIYDSRQVVLVGNRLVFNVTLLSDEVKGLEQVVDKVSSVLGVKPQRLLKNFKKNFLAPFVPTVIAQDVPKEAAITLECKEVELPGLVIQAEPQQDFRGGESFCHLLGYLGKISEQELSQFKEYGLRTTDLVGRAGVEAQFDCYLRGEPGGLQVEVNNRGHLVRVLGAKQPKPGKDLYLTIDAQLQKFVNSLFDSLAEGKKGACIVINPQDGEIKALVSKPSFDPNLFMAAINDNSEAMLKVRRLLDSEQAVLINRAISATYPPGSIFKIVVACAGLETGRITTETEFNCPGSLRVGNRDFFCWNLDGHGRENISSAITHSCNVFFYNLGLRLGAEKLTFFARTFGLGEPTGIDLPGESAGFVPSKAWKLKMYKDRWYDGETVNFSIGQGYLLVTPIQVAQMVSVIANGGYLVRPHLVKKIGTQEAAILRKRIALKKETFEIIKQGMLGVIQDEGGTGHQAYLPGTQWAAKTGTAQVTMGLAHGWFVGFYPVEQPRVLVLTFLEYGGSGGGTAAAIAKEIIQYIRESEKTLVEK